MSETDTWELEFEDKIGTFETRVCRNEYWLEDSTGPRPVPVKKTVHADEGWWQLLTVEANSRHLEELTFKKKSGSIDDGDNSIRREDENAYDGCSRAEITDHNIKAFSYYWVQRNMHKYENILSRLGYNVPELFGSHPDEWNYTEIAAPLFLDKQS